MDPKRAAKLAALQSVIDDCDEVECEPFRPQQAKPVEEPTAEALTADDIAALSALPAEEM